MNGMKHSRGSVTAKAKRRLGVKGGRDYVLAAVEAEIEKLLPPKAKVAVPLVNEKVPKNPLTVEVEHTDTFGGEANYSWVTRKRFTVPEEFSDRAIITKAKDVLGLNDIRHKRSDLGDMIRLDLVGMCQVVFITFPDND